MFWWLSLNSALASRLIHIDDPRISIQLFESKCEFSHFNSYRHPNFKQFRMSIRNHWLSINYTELGKLNSYSKSSHLKKLLHSNKKQLLCFDLFWVFYIFYSIWHTFCFWISLIKLYWGNVLYVTMVIIACTVCSVSLRCSPICLPFPPHNFFSAIWKNGVTSL